MSIEITTNAAGRIVAITPYHPSFPGQARALGGKFDRETKTWNFDPRDEARVREMVTGIFGTDGTPTETVTVRVTAVAPFEDARSLYLAGREILTKPGRDIAPRLGEGVVKLAGTFNRRGGSVANPIIGGIEGVVLEVRDLPAVAADLELDGWKIEVIDTAVDVEALRAERERLVARLAEIDGLLA